MDDIVFSEEEGSREVVVTSAEHRVPAATSAGDEQEVTRCAMASALRKHAASVDAFSERSVKQT